MSQGYYLCFVKRVDALRFATLTVANVSQASCLMDVLKGTSRETMNTVKLNVEVFALLLSMH